MARPDGVVERALTLAPPHQPVNVVRAQVVFNQPEPEIPRVGVARARAHRRPAVQIDLDRLVQSAQVAAEDVFEPADHLHAAAARRRQHVGDDVVIRMVGRLLRNDGRSAIELRVRRREVAAVIGVVVFLHPVIGKRTAARLPAANPAPVGERRQKQRVDGGEIAEGVQHLVGAFVQERDRTDLNADHRRVGGLAVRRRQDQTAGCQQRALEKRASIHGETSFVFQQPTIAGQDGREGQDGARRATLS